MREYVLQQGLGWGNKFKFSANQSEEYVSANRGNGIRQSMKGNICQSGWRDIMSSANQGEGLYVPPVRVGNMLCFHQSGLENMIFANQSKGMCCLLIRVKKYVCSASHGDRLCVLPTRLRENVSRQSRVWGNVFRQPVCEEYVFCHSWWWNVCSANQGEGTCITPIRMKVHVLRQSGWENKCFRELERGICFRH